MTVQIARNVRVVTSAGRNLFEIAAEEYGDHTLWNVIARANRRRDPFIEGVVDLVIPEKPAAARDNTGVVGA